MTLVKNFILAASLLFATVTAGSQTVTISPTPQQITWGSKAYDSSGTHYRITGTPSATVQTLLDKNFEKGADAAVEIIVGKAGDEAIEQWIDKIPDQPEGYYLNVTPDKIIVAGRDDSGTYYGIQSLLQVVSQPEVMSVTVTDWPMTSVRGVIEGFYGNPWSFENRISQFDFYGANKMNIYIYGPKDDPYHHSRWYDPYPQAEADKIARLVKHAAENNVKFVWAMHPSNSITSDSDRKKALAKFEQMYNLGVRAFSIFFDDISAESVNSQVSYLNFLTDEFVNKKPDVEPMIVCPTQYNKAWSSGNYLSTMGNGLYPEIRIMWTGNSVVDMIQKNDCDWFRSQTGRAPFIWLNYPVNDYGQHNLLMGPVKDNGTDIYDQVSAFCSNPMQYAEASKVAIYSIADYAWNPVAYNADDAWERSMKYLMPDHTEAFRDFCLSNVDVAPSAHGLRLYGETPAFKAIQDKYSELTPEAIEAYSAYFTKMKSSAEELLSLEGTSEMIDEILEFVQHFDYQSLRGQKVMLMASALADGNTTDFINAYTDYKNATEQAGRLVSRNFAGSIQSVAPHTATLYMEPFIKKTVAQLITSFKASGAEYPADLFPAQLLENGLYYIKVNNKYLTNVNGSNNPTLLDNIDNVNPGRQMWVITLEPETERYSIKNEWDKRYVNELGNFGTNPYEDIWHTYTITRFENRYAIQNGGSAGKAFWKSSDGRINKRTATDYHNDNFIFEIIPVNQETTEVHPSIVGKDVYLLNNSGLAFTEKGKGTPGEFKELITPADNRQLFTVSIEPETGCVKFTNVATNQHLDEIGRVGSATGYGPAWNTYAVTEMNGLYSIRYTLSAMNYYGARYWIPGENMIEYKADLDLYNSYLFRIVPINELSSIDQIIADDADCNVFDMLGRKINCPAKGLYIVNGKKKILR